MSYADHTPGYRIETKAQALTWLLDEVQTLEAWRQKLDIGVADLGAEPKPGTVGELRRDFRKFLVRHGSVAGTLTTLHRLDQLTDEQYQAARERITLTLVRFNKVLSD